MWVIFLLSAMSVAMVGLLIMYVANLTFIAMQKEQEKFKHKKENNNE